MRKSEGKWIMKKERRMISKDGTIFEFSGYTSSKEEEDEKEEEESENKVSKKVSEIRSNSESSGYAASENEVESDLESTSRSEPKCKKIEYTCQKMAPNRRSSPSNDKNSDIAAINAQQLQNILPHIITKVTNNVNNANANGGNEGNNRCPYKTFLACNRRDYDGKGGADQTMGREAAMGMTWVEFKALLVEDFCPSNEMEKLETKLVLYLVTLEFKRIGRILTDEEVRCGTLTRSSEKRKEVEETTKQGGSWKDNKKANVGKGFVATAPPRNVNIDAYPKDVFVIVCHKKMVRIPMEGGEILRVQRERTLGGTKTLMSMKADEPELSDIPIVRDFLDVFPKDLLGLPLQRQVDFRVDLIPGATPVAKSLYRLVLEIRK
nr:hypothetical protein [Tanacetum cinerariifolium]